MIVLMAAYGIGSLVATVGVVRGDLTVIVAGRVLQGGSAGVVPLSFSIIRRTGPPERVAVRIGLISSMLALGGAISLPLGGVVIDQFGVDWIFVVGVLTGVLSAVALLVFVPVSPREPDARVDLLGAALLGTGVCGLLLGVTTGARAGWWSMSGGGLVALGAVVLIGWVLVERRLADPIVNVRTLAQGTVLRANLVTFLVGFGMFGLFFLLPFLLQLSDDDGGLAMSATGAALVAMPVALVNFAVSPALGLVGRVHGLRVPVILGCLIGGLSLGLIAAAPAVLAVMVLASLLWGVGFAGGMAGMSNLVVHAVPPRQTAEVAGMNIIVRNIGAAVGTQVATGVMALAAAHGATPVRAAAAAFATGAGACLVATGVALLIPRVLAGPGPTSTGP